jgi:hypothetical protein
LSLIAQHFLQAHATKRISYGWRDTAIRLIRIAFVFFCTACTAFLSVANAASLGEAELRSWLGEPLDIRIPVLASAAEDEILDATCLKISADSEPFSLVRELRVTLAGVERERFYTLRGYTSINEPYIKLIVRIQCAGQGAISRQYTLLLDPRPTLNPPAVAPIATPTNITEPKQNAQRLSGQWVTPSTTDNNRADSLATIAEGVYPKSIKRKARYIAALRQLNPSLAGLADNATLPPNIALTLPDLRTLSTTRKVVAAAVAKPSNAAPLAPTTSQQPAQVTRPKSPPRLQLSGQIPPQAPRAAAKAPVATAAVAPATAPATFSLKLSGGEIDTARSLNVTEEQRAILREKQFLLDADDQIAQFLSLKNTVKQLENRLNQVQSRLDNDNATPPQTAATQPALKPPAQTAVAPPISPVRRTWYSGFSTLGIVVTIILLAIIVAIGIWLSRRRAARAMAQAEAEIAQLSAIEDEKNSPQNQSSDLVATIGMPTSVSPEIAAQNHADDVALAIRRSKGVIATATPAPPATLIKPDFDPAATLILDAPDSHGAQSDINLFDDNVDNNSIQFDLDNSPSTTVDFLVGDSDADSASNVEANADLTDKAQSDEARVRRRQYMYERYPELMSNTVSIDDADSVINTARHYLVETEAGAARATELLGYALEERPQEIRFWLAQFEAFRLKSMAAEYIELAHKFSILFGQSVEWRHVRQIGHDLAPTNSLFLPSSEAPSKATFDSSIWLTADPAKTKLADSLAIALRTELIQASSAKTTKAYDV